MRCTLKQKQKKPIRPQAEGGLRISPFHWSPGVGFAVSLVLTSRSVIQYVACSRTAAAAVTAPEGRVLC